MSFRWSRDILFKTLKHFLKFLCYYWSLIFFDFIFLFFFSAIIVFIVFTVFTLLRSGDFLISSCDCLMNCRYLLRVFIFLFLFLAILLCKMSFLSIFIICFILFITCYFFFIDYSIQLYFDIFIFVILKPFSFRGIYLLLSSIIAVFLFLYLLVVQLEINLRYSLYYFLKGFWLRVYYRNYILNIFLEILVKLVFIFLVAVFEAIRYLKVF